MGHKISFCLDISVLFCPKQNCQIKRNLLKFSNLDPSFASNAYLRLVYETGCLNNDIFYGEDKGKFLLLKDSFGVF